MLKKLLKHNSLQNFGLPRSNFYTIGSKQGFSIIEVLIALSLFGLLTSGIITYVTAGLDVTKKTEAQLQLLAGENQQELLLQNLITHPIKRIDDGLPSSTSSTTGAIFAIDTTTMFVGTQSMTGFCIGSPNQQYLVLHSANGVSANESQSFGNYYIAPDGLSVYSGGVRIMGSGVRGGNIGSPLDTEFGGLSSISGTGNLLAIADPNNEQIIFWNTDSATMSILTTRTTGIIYPSSIKFSSNGMLVGAKNGIFRMHDGTETGGDLKKTIASGPKFPTGDLDRMEIQFDGISNLTGPTNESSLTLERYTSGNWENLKNSSGSWSISAGIGTYIFSGSTRSIGAGEDIRIAVGNISPSPSISNHYSANINFYSSGGSLVWNKKIPYFVKGDGEIQTLAGNIIEKISTAQYARELIDQTQFLSGGIGLDNYLAANGEKVVSGLPIRNFQIIDTSKHYIILFESYTDYDCKEGNHKSREKALLLRKK